MTNKCVLKSHSLVIPDFDCLVPRSADNNWILSVLVELNARNPVGMGVLFNGEFAFSNGVPDLKVFISSTTGNLSVIWGESD